MNPEDQANRGILRIPRQYSCKDICALFHVAWIIGILWSSGLSQSLNWRRKRSKFGPASTTEGTGDSFRGVGLGGDLGSANGVGGKCQEVGFGQSKGVGPRCLLLVFSVQLNLGPTSEGVEWGLFACWYSAGLGRLAGTVIDQCFLAAFAALCEPHGLPNPPPKEVEERFASPTGCVGWKLYPADKHGPQHTSFAQPSFAIPPCWGSM